jgi:flagellar hook-associated protein 3 FlgL
MTRISTVAAYSYAAHSLGGQQAELAKLSAQISSGKRILTPSDDPQGAARVIELESQLSRNTQLQSNQIAAINTLSQAESLLGTVDETYNDIRAILVQAGNAALSDNDRLSLAAELAGRREALYGLSISRDGDGQPLFGSRVVQVGTSRDLDVVLNHNLLFGLVPDGNGVFSAAAAGANTGNAAISAGTVADATALDGKSYDIIVHDSGGVLTYDIKNVTDNTMVSTGNAFNANAPITVAGMSVKIAGAPADGDTFHLAPPVKRPVFNALDELVQALRAPVNDDASRARIAASVASGLAQLDNAAETSRLTRASTGAALQELDTLQSVAATQDVQLQTQLASIRDLDYTQAATELSQRQLTLEAAQKAYSKTLGHSLFDYL